MKMQYKCRHLYWVSLNGEFYGVVFKSIMSYENEMKLGWNISTFNGEFHSMISKSFNFKTYRDLVTVLREFHNSFVLSLVKYIVMS